MQNIGNPQNIKQHTILLSQKPKCGMIKQNNLLDPILLSFWTDVAKNGSQPIFSRIIKLTIQKISQT